MVGLVGFFGPLGPGVPSTASAMTALTAAILGPDLKHVVERRLRGQPKPGETDR